MKPLFFLLCLLNLGFFLWQFHNGKLSPVEAASDRPGADVLTLEEYERARIGATISAMLHDNLKRRQQAEIENIAADLRGPQAHMPPVKIIDKPLKPRPIVTTAQAEKPLPPVQPAIVRKCFEAGPFADEADAKKWLAQKALTGKQLLARDKLIGSDFQVYFPAGKTPEQARADKLFLQEKGLADIWTIQEGDKKGAISLGVFNDKARAVIFKSQLAARGIAAEIRQRDKTQAQWFARLMLDKTAFKQYGSPAVKLSPCPGM